MMFAVSNLNFTMKNKKAMQLAISTLILIVLGILVLLAIIYAVTDGFDFLRSTTGAFLNSEQVKAAIQICQDACASQIPLTYCCQEFDYKEAKFKCTDSRLDLECPAINCENVCDQE